MNRRSFLQCIIAGAGAAGFRGASCEPPEEVETPVQESPVAYVWHVQTPESWTSNSGTYVQVELDASSCA